jgi:hypothetical protein
MTDPENQLHAAGSPTNGGSTTTKRSESLFKCFGEKSCESFDTFVGIQPLSIKLSDRRRKRPVGCNSR